MNLSKVLEFPQSGQEVGVPDIAEMGEERDVGSTWQSRSWMLVWVERSLDML